MMKSRLFWSKVGSTVYDRKRIPGLTVTSKGTMLICYEARKANSDWALMDVLCERSVDGGETFEEPILLAKGDETHPTVNNPVMIEDQNGRIHFLYCEDYGTDGGRILRRYSDDDGLTWSNVIDITDVTVPAYRNAFALGPGHGICTSDGMLLIPCWMVPKYFDAPVRAHRPSVVTTFYSLDNGETWQLGEILSQTGEIVSPNETVAAELSDGNIYLSIRNGAPSYRCKAVSKNGRSDWEGFDFDLTLIDPQCFGSIVSCKTDRGEHMLLLVNCEHHSERKNVVVKGSLDDGKTWTSRCVIDADRGGYADIAFDPTRGLIYVLYEDVYGESLYLATLTLDDLEKTV